MKRILIIGATSATAAACARLWAAQGAEFFLVADDTEQLHSAAVELKAQGAQAVTLHTMHAAHFGEHPRMLGLAASALGRIDVALVAYGTAPDQKACELDVGLTLQAFITNAATVITLLTVLAQQFERQRCGSLVVLPLDTGDCARATDYVYGSSQAAVSTFCEGLQARLRRVGAHVMILHDSTRRLTRQPTKAARRIVAGIERKATTLYASGIRALIMPVIDALPQPVFRRLSP